MKHAPVKPAYKLEQHTAKATADLLGPIFWTATDSRGTTGYGATPEAAISHLERITKWRTAT